MADQKDLPEMNDFESEGSDTGSDDAGDFWGDDGTVEDSEITSEVKDGISDAKDFAAQLTNDDIVSGSWFTKLLVKVASTYKANARAEYFKKKYPGFTSDQIAEKLIGVATRYSSITGAVSGVATTAGIAGIAPSAGLSASIIVTTIGAEMIYLSSLQMRLVLDIATAYGIQLDMNDPEDVLIVFLYASGVAPSDIIGRFAATAAGGGTKFTVKSVVTGSTLKAFYKWSEKIIGTRIVQATVIKFTVPVVSAAVGSAYNYCMTQAVGHIARTHFRNRDHVTEELRALISQQQTYQIVFPAAAIYIAKVDNQYGPKEMELYKAILSRMSLEEFEQREFDALANSADRILEAVKALPNPKAGEILLDLLCIMAVYDGELAKPELEFLLKVAGELEIDIDLASLEARAERYRIDYSSSTWRSVLNVAGDALGSTAGAGAKLLTIASDKAKAGYTWLFSRGNVNLADDDSDILPFDDSPRPT